MCGIVGVIDKKDFCTDCLVIEEMLKITKHRGPDDCGTADYSFPVGELYSHCMVGFNRLSIRDLSYKGHQPMVSEDGDVIVTFNGEIYNSEELRPLLQEKGYSFTSSTDTEVLLKMYQEFGLDETLKQIDGMFAICIIDKRINCIYLIRDRIGEKPLYYYENQDVFLFASEYKAFYCHPTFQPILNEDAVDEYFMFRYVSGEDTLLKGVQKLAPGNYIKVNTNTRNIVKYWDLPNVQPNNLSKDENRKELERLLKLSVRRRLLSDVPVGLQLSGGVDSSVMAAYIKECVNDRLKTFSITTEYKKYSEKEYIDVVNNKFNLDESQYLFNSATFFKAWLQTTWYFENPMHHEGTLGLLYLNHHAKKDVTVMLCGEGADETLGGYSRFSRLSSMLHHKEGMYYFYRLLQYIVSILKARKFLPNILRADLSFITETQFVPSYMFYKMRKGREGAMRRVYDKRKEILLQCPGKGIHKYLNYEIKTYLLETLLRTDKVSMASSMEARVPFLMPELVEFECSIPEEYLVDDMQSHPIRAINLKRYLKSLIDTMHSTKILLKELCSDIFGEEFAYRGKMGFPLPILYYMNDDHVIAYIEKELLPGIKRRNVVDYNTVIKAWNNRKNSKMHNVLWSALSFELWAKMYLDSKPQEWQESVKF